MTILGNILLGLASVIYLVPLQLFLREPINHGGQAAGGVIGFIFVTIPLWVLLFLVWCILLPRGGFDWLGGGRAWQLLVIVVSCLALLVVTSMAAMLREDPQIPWMLRPLMPWGIYVLPLFALLASALLLNPALVPSLSSSAARLTLASCGALALISTIGMAGEWLVWQQKRAAASAREEVEFHDQNILRIVAEVEALDPMKDLGRLLGHAAANRFEAPRELAQKKISTHPHLQDELARGLTNQWSIETLGYLELKDAPDSAALAVPVRIALESLTPWIQRELERSTQFWSETYYSETRMALAVADKFAPHGVDYVPAMRALRDAFNHPHAKVANLQAPALIDAWLAGKARGGRGQVAGSRP